MSSLDRDPDAPSRSPATQGSAQERHFDGVVLVADIAGYTALAEGLGRSGATGIERLGQLLDSTLSAQFAAVERHGGQLGSVVGDAIVAYWPAHDGDAPGCMAQARACVRELLATATGPESLSIHAGLGAGSIWAAECEGWQTQTLFGGAAVREAFHLAKAAHAGQVLASDRLPGPAVGPSAIANTLRPAAGEIPAVDPRSASPAAGQGDLWRAELCNVAALFLRLPEFDEARPGEWRRHRRALLLIRELAGASRASGRLVIDERGLVCVSVFGELTGASPEAPEITAERARQLTSALQRAGFPVAAGLAFGPAFCGKIGTRSSTTLVTVGPVMNLAARLMDRAGSELLVAEPPSARFRGEIRHAPIESLSLHGLQSEVRALRPALLPKPQRAAVFGRDEERLRLQRMLAALLRGEGGVCLVRADAGMGKSTLLHAVAEMAGALQLRMALGHAREAERTVALFPWRAVMRGLFPAWEHQPEAELRASLVAQLDRVGQEVALAPLLNAVFDAGFPQTERTEVLLGRSRAEATLELLLALIRDAARRPVVIGIDDIHVADSASLELVQRVSERLDGVLLIVAARPSQQTSELIYQLAGTRYHQLDLHALARSDVEAIIASRLGQAAIEPEVIDAVLRASEGNPLFAQEYLALLAERGRVHQRDGRVVLVAPQADAAPLSPPPTVIAAVSSRIHALPVREQQLIKLASVVGESFSSDTLEQMVHLTAVGGEVEPALRNLERSGLVVQRSLHADSFGFTHAVVREAAYEMMLLEQRSRLHAEVGRILEQRYERERDAMLPSLVHHYAAAGDDRRTLLFADMAAAAALRQGSFREAAEFLRLCLAAAARAPGVLDDAEPRVRWNRQLSEAMAALGDLGARRAHALAAIRSAGVRIHGSALAARVQTIATLLWRSLRPTPGRERRPAERAPAPIDRELARAFHHLAVSNYFASDRIWFPHYILHALAQAERVGRSPELARALASAGACFGYLGLDRLGRRYLAAATTIGEALADRPALAFVDMVSALYHIHRGGWDEAARRIRRCHTMARAIGDNQVWGEAQTIAIWIDIYRGDVAAAMEGASELRAMAERSSNDQHVCWAHRFVGICHQRRGELAEAIKHLETARTLLVNQKDLNEIVLAGGVLSGVLARVGRLDEAEALALPLLERLERERRPTSHALIEGCSGLAEAALRALAASRPASASASIHDVERANRALARVGRTFPIGLPRYYYFQGRLLAQLGKTRSAHKHWRRGHQQAERLHMQYDLQQLGAVLG